MFKFFKKIKQQILINVKVAFKSCLKIYGILFSLLGVFGLFISFTEFFPEGLELIKKILFVGIGILSVGFILFFLVLIYYSFIKRSKELFSDERGNKVFLEYGNIFDINKLKKIKTRRNIVIPVNRCFDTHIDDDLISSKKSLHGIVMKSLYDAQITNEEELNSILQNSIITYHSINLSSQQKPSGNLKRYDVGTVAEYKLDEKITFFFLGLCKLDQNLHAETKEEEFLFAIQKLLRFYNTRSQGYDLYLPIIGSGLSNTRKSEKDLLEYLISILKINKELINSNIHIVIYEKKKDQIAISSI